jgi:tetratricopeptide (TPR) repeat protein
MPFPLTRSRHDGPPRRLALISALLVLAAPAVQAAPAEDEGVRAGREHYRKGEEAYNAGRFDDAYREFETGYATTARPAFLLNMAHTERRRGSLRNARALYLKFLLVEPQSKYRDEVQQVVRELDGALAAEEAAAATQRPPPPPLPAAAPPLVVPAFVESPAPAPRRPLYQRWWAWGAVGAVVVAAVVTGVALSGGSYQKDGSLGTLGPR